MNINQLIDSMNPEEQGLALNYLRDIENKKILIAAKRIELSGSMKALATQNKIKAIKEVKKREDCTLRIAKGAVDEFLKSLDK